MRDRKFSVRSSIIEATVGKRTSQLKQRTPHQKKGDALENALNSIEQFLLKITPELSEQDFKFETKKQVAVDGGQREIDIYATHKAAHGYDSIFIYECRNRKSQLIGRTSLPLAERLKLRPQHGAALSPGNLPRQHAPKPKRRESSAVSGTGNSRTRGFVRAFS